MTTAPPPGTTSTLIKDAHYHAIAATATWQTFIQAMMQEVTDSPAYRARRDERRADATTYARGTLGGH